MPCLNPEIALLGLFLSSTFTLSTLFCNSIDDKQALHRGGQVNKLWKLRRILHNDIAPEFILQGCMKLDDFLKIKFVIRHCLSGCLYVLLFDLTFKSFQPLNRQTSPSIPID